MSNERRWFEQSPPEPQAGPRPTDVAKVKALWNQCPNCKEVLQQEDLDQSLQCCPHCDYHLKFDSLERMLSLVDEDSFVRHDEQLAPDDPLQFMDSKKYSDRIEASQAKTGENDAFISGSATIEGVAVQVGTFNFGFMGGSMGSVVGELITRL